MRRPRMNSLLPLLLGLIAFPLIPACSSAPVAPDKLEGTLTVAALSENGFLRSYGNALSIHYPHVQINIKAMPDSVKTIAQLTEWMSATPADLYMINNPLFYLSMVDSGSLLPLDVLVKKSGLQVDDDPLGATAYLREMGGGMLYALPSSFKASALFLNKTLFESEGVPLPDRPMSWRETLALADRFESPHFGLDDYATSPGQMLVSIAERSGLQLWNGKQMTIDSPEWRNEAAEFQRLFAGGRLELTLTDQFIQGKAAITEQYPSYGETLDGKKLSFEWQMLAPPVLDNERQTSAQLTMEGLIGIGADSSNPDLAWELLAYMIGKQVSVPSLDDLPIYYRPAAINGVDLDPLYSVRFGSYRPDNEGLAPDQPIRDLAIKQFDRYLQGMQSIDDTIKRIGDDGKRLIEAD